MNALKQRLVVTLVMAMSSTFSYEISAFENSQVQMDTDTPAASNAGFSGHIRLGYISIDNELDASVQSSAIGGALHYRSENWQGISANGSLYTTHKVFHDDEGSFFGSDGNGYAILGQAYLKANIENTEVKLGRFGFDSPYLDKNDVRIVPNSFSGIMVANTDISDTTLYAAHLTEWSSVDSNKPESFTDLLGSDNVNVLGVVYQGIDNVALQSWYYNAKDLADFFYVDATVELDNITLGAQFGKQSATSNIGPDGDVYGIMASYTLNDFTFKSSYNHVSDTIINGFGGGPYYANAADHTISGVLDQSALAIGVDYSGFNNLTLGLLNVAFDKGADELDLFVSYYFSENMAFDFIYHHIHEDGKMVLAMFNIGF